MYFDGPVLPLFSDGAIINSNCWVYLRPQERGAGPLGPEWPQASALQTTPSTLQAASYCPVPAALPTPAPASGPARGSHRTPQSPGPLLVPNRESRFHSRLPQENSQRRKQRRATAGFQSALAPGASQTWEPRHCHRNTSLRGTEEQAASERGTERPRRQPKRPV